MKQNKKRSKQREKRGNFFSFIINFLSSLKLTIPLLIILAGLSIIGTVITQNASEAEYLQRYSKETYYFMKGLGLFNMYHSLWFMGVLVLLVINLIACSWKRLPGVWRQVRKTKSGYARLGTYLTHLSVLLILAGGLIGAIWGAKGYVEIVEGETVARILLRKLQWMMRPLSFVVRCDAFRVDFYPDGSPKEYISTLTFFEGEQVVLDHVPLRVNQPISYKGLNFYQSDYGIISVSPIVEVRGKGAFHTMQLKQGEPQPIPGTEVYLGFMQYRGAVHGHGEAILLVLFPPDSEPEGFWLFKGNPGMEGLQVGDFSFIFEDLEQRYYTGIQVAHNPGVSVVWVGCSLLVIGMMVTFTLRRPPKGTPSQDT
ncbi:MAG: cytochrome c biogenesis protein ResB [Deltaproteobacteria bacterium]|nr:cytochrome c biogenesis protein ResB [Deltaproteobacteria bacterium]